MRNAFNKLSASTFIIITSALPASAQWNNGGGNANGWGNALAAPEIDASSGMLAVAALSIILLYVVERRRQAQKAVVKAEA